MLAEASLHGDPTASRALEDFCRRYRAPIVAMIRRRGVLEERVEDVAHDFMVHLMTHSALKRADPGKGRFRQFLTGTLAYFLADDCDRHGAKKRGGGLAPLSLDASDGLGQAVTAPAWDESAMDREWAVALFSDVMKNLEQEWIRAEKSARFAVLRAFLPGATQATRPDHAAAALGISAEAFRSELHRLRAAFRDRLRRAVAETVSRPSDVDSELRHLLDVLIAQPLCPEDSKG